MNSRRNRSKALAAVVLLHFAATVVLADEEDRNPVIVAAMPDSSVNPTQLKISGQNLGASKPLVTLDSVPLSVVGVTSAIVTVWLHAGLKPGSYRLTLEPNGHSERLAEFDVALGAIGPKADRGDPGPRGLRDRWVLLEHKGRRDRRAQAVRATFTPLPHRAWVFASSVSKWPR
jgi:hypothetical protein